jgi:hypothetical protein
MSYVVFLFLNKFLVSILLATKFTRMKNTITLFILIFFGTTLSAQGVFTNQTNGTLEKVIQDYPNQFKNIKGDLLESNPRSSEYKSNIAIPGAVSTTVTQYSVADKHIVSWQTIIYSTSEFDEAKKRFKELYGEIKNTIIKLEGEKPVILNGQYEIPAEEKKYTTVVFDLLPSTGATQKLKIDLMLEKVNREWKIVLSVYDKERKQGEAIVSK